MFADFGTVGGEIDACLSGNINKKFYTSNLDTNSSALNFFYGLSGFHFEKGDGIFDKFWKLNKIIFFFSIWKLKILE